tara:strand:+ start:2000 stop:2473 length:474 start_codon:yes stop_codon:yes gene_type:complete
MKIYNKNLNLKNLNVDFLQEYKYKTRNVSYIYTKKGIYRIYDNNDLHEINIQDGKIDYIDNYVNKDSYIIDHTIIKKLKKFVSNIPYDHVKHDLTINYYTLRQGSPILFVVEFINDTNNIYDAYFMLRDTYAAYSDADIYNPFVLEDIGEFCNIIKL